MIDAGCAVDDEVLAQLAGNLVAVDDHVLDVSLGLKSVNALSNSFASSAMPRERSLPVTQGVSALKQAKRWSRSCALNTATWVSHSRPVSPTSSLSGGAMCVWTK